MIIHLNLKIRNGRKNDNKNDNKMRKLELEKRAGFVSNKVDAFQIDIQDIRDKLLRTEQF